MGTLYIVGVPAGDPQDLTLRALRTLEKVALAVPDGAAHDLPQVERLWAHHGITTPLTILSEPGPSAGFDHALTALETADLAFLASDWLPGLSELGRQLIQGAIERNFPIETIPGPSLPVTALIVSGLPADSFVYLGQLPPEAIARRHLLTSLAAERRTLVFQESPERLSELLDALGEVLGDRPLALVPPSGAWREGIWRGTVREASAYLPEKTAQGAWVLVVGGAPERVTRWDEEQLRSEIQVRLDQGLGVKGISRQLAPESGWPRREIYRLAVEISQ